MLAQELCDLREETGFCSGQDLHGFFLEELGDPSPSGHAEIEEVAAIRFVHDRYQEMHTHSPNAAAEIAAVVDAFVTGKKPKVGDFIFVEWPGRRGMQLMSITGVGKCKGGEDCVFFYGTEDGGIIGAEAVEDLVFNGRRWEVRK